MKLFLFLSLLSAGQMTFASVEKIECDNGHQIKLDHETGTGTYNQQEIVFSSTYSSCRRCDYSFQTIIIHLKNYFGFGLKWAVLEQKNDENYELSGSYHRPARVGPQDHPFTSTCHSEG